SGLFLSVRLRPFPRQAASSFCCRILSFLPFPLAFLCFLTAYPDGLQKCAWRRFLHKGESFFTGTFRYA
ncbi:MAG: hypothetical protein KH088_13345, partial [Bacteroides sp.]|nr:hypothetical protein [Bacteroides sp.]